MADRPIKLEPFDERQVEIYRGMTGAQRLEVSWQMWDWARQLVRTRLASQHPDWDDARLEQAASKELLDATA